METNPHPTLPRKPRRPEPPAGTPEHAEWLLDEASEESFPASDPPAPANPGSSAAVNQIHEEGRGTTSTEDEAQNKKK